MLGEQFEWLYIFYNTCVLHMGAVIAGVFVERVFSTRKLAEAAALQSAKGLGDSPPKLRHQLTSIPSTSETT